MDINDDVFTDDKLWIEYLHTLSEVQLERSLENAKEFGWDKEAAEIQAVLDEKLADVVGGGRY